MELPFPCFFRASDLPLVNMFVEERQRGGGGEGEREGREEVETKREVGDGRGKRPLGGRNTVFGN